MRAGYVTHYGGEAKDLYYLTVAGSGHMVPQFQPIAAHKMINTFISHGQFE